MIPKHWAKPTGVSSFRPEQEKVICHQCGKSHSVNGTSIIGNIDYPSNRYFCSSTCSTTAHNEWRKNKAIGPSYQ